MTPLAIQMSAASGESNPDSDGCLALPGALCKIFHSHRVSRNEDRQKAPLIAVQFPGMAGAGRMNPSGAGFIYAKKQISLSERLDQAAVSRAWIRQLKRAAVSRAVFPQA